jgi:DNA-binding LytR/AlgR family response regulator
MMNCIIVEDQLPAQRILKKYIQDAGGFELIGCYTDGLEAMEVLSSQNIDVMFLDIHLPKISGIDFLKSLTKPPRVIFTTAFQDYALESYEFNVVDYLLKPFSFQRFVKAISKIKIERDIANSYTGTVQSSNSSEKVKENNLDEIYIKSGYDLIRVKTEDIIYILTDSDYTELHLKEKKHLSSESLRYWEMVLPSKNYIRIHKSYIINTSKIVKVSGNQVFLECNNVVPIGRAYKNEFTKQLLK